MFAAWRLVALLAAVTSVALGDADFRGNEERVRGHTGGRCRSSMLLYS